MAARRPRTLSRSNDRSTGDSVAVPGAATELSESSSFAALGVPAPLVRALAQVGVTAPFPIQTATLPDALAGRDVLGSGRTGSGKTYAFALPLLARLAASASPRRPGRPRALVLAPTRELATQIEASIAPLAAALSLRTLTVFGGVKPGRQIAGLRSGVDILVACPGRLADHIESGYANLDSVEVTVLDEADHMADLGFLPVVRRLLDQTPRGGQRLLFSATLDTGVDVLVRRFLTNPITHSVDPLPEAAPVPHHVLHVEHHDRLAILVDLAASPGRTLVFARTKRRAKTLTRQLVQAGVSAAELHGNLAQNVRDRNLQAFAAGEATTLVATDIAARGIHVDDVALVVHADPPAEYKAYLHRSGRTGRAGATGTVVTLMTDDQVSSVRQLARLAGIAPTTTRLRPGHPLLGQIAPGQRTFVKLPSPAPVTRNGNGGGTARNGNGNSGGTARNNGNGNGGGTARNGNGAAPRRGRPRRGAGRPGPEVRQDRPAAVGAVRTSASAASSAPRRSSGAAAFSSGSRAGGARRGGTR